MIDNKEDEIKEVKKKIEELRKKVESIENRYKKDLYKSRFEKEKFPDSYEFERKKYKKILVALIITVFIIDLIAFIFYYKPDIKLFFKNNLGNSSINENNSNLIGNKKCSDGTLEGECSRKQPYFCYEGQLIKKASQCGCPVGWKRDFQDCVSI
ncbi:MAG: hypothetical protein QXW97_02365 [Candidatus Pacearchaeota archaeon]